MNSPHLPIPNPLNVLYATYNGAIYMPPTTFSDHQVIVGPHYPTEVKAGVVRSAFEPDLAYDLSVTAAALPPAQTPDLTVALVGGHMRHVPTNLARVPGRRLLLVTDTHHGKYPLRSVIDYIKRESYHRVASIHNPHHLHWLAEAGVKEPGVIPNVDVIHFERPIEPQRRPCLVFVGQTGRWHPRRNHLLEAMRQAALPVEVQGVEAPAAAEFYNTCQISFNCSLNGDLNMRVFEVLAAGGFLMTDRLAPQAGLSTYFRPGEDYVEYDGAADLIEKVRYYLANPDLCLKIARSGHAAYLAAHTPAARHRQVIEFAFGGAPPPFSSDPRGTPGGEGFGENLLERLQVYEVLQVLARDNERVVIAGDGALGARVISDWVDLLRLKVKVVGPCPDTLCRGLSALGVADQVAIAADGDARANVLIAGPKFLEQDQMLGEVEPDVVMIIGGPLSELGRGRLAARNYGQVDTWTWMFQKKR